MGHAAKSVESDFHSETRPTKAVREIKYMLHVGMAAGVTHVGVTSSCVGRLRTAALLYRPAAFKEMHRRSVTSSPSLDRKDELEFPWLPGCSSIQHQGQLRTPAATKQAEKLYVTKKEIISRRQTGPVTRFQLKPVVKSWMHLKFKNSGWTGGHRSWKTPAAEICYGVGSRLVFL